MENPLFLGLVKVAIFTLMLALGVNLSPEKGLRAWRRPGPLLRGLLAVVVLVPIMVMLLLLAFDLPPAVATGLALLAAAPGAPLTTKRAQMAGANLPYTWTLQLTLAVLAVGITPLTLAIFHARFELETEGVPILEVARQIAMVQLLPVAIGILFQRIAPSLAERIGKPVILLANVLFLLLVALLVVPAVRILGDFGLLPTLAVVTMAAVALAIGHVLGGPASDERAALATASIARNIGLALFIAGLNHAEKLLAPTLVAYMILGSIVALPYAFWIRRREAREAAPEAP
jgi:BASS family bile acid:Na+ symporter